MLPSTQSRRLLFLLPFAPRLDGAHGGSRVLAELLSRLTLRHQVALLYMRADGEPAIDDLLLERCALVEEVRRPTSEVVGNTPWLAAAFDILGLLRGRPLWCHYWANNAYKQRVTSLAATWQPDIVQIEFQIMAQYLPALDQCPAPRVLTVHEPAIQAAHERWKLSSTSRLSKQYLDLLAWRRFEPSILRKLDSVVVFTERDRELLGALPAKTPVVSIPLGASMPQQPLNPLGLHPPTLLFVGNFIHPPNVDAARRLVHGIFPGVQKVIDEVRLNIVGSDPPVDILQLANETVRVTGLVPDVTPYLDGAALVVVPLRLGGGMRVKVLEALAAGKAIVASPLAVEGLDLLDAQTLLLAESDVEFVQAITHLLCNHSERAALAARARTWACQHLAWDRTVMAYERLYKQLLA